jgi:hypothetical protein
MAKQGIEIIAGFDVKSESPIDVRTLCETVDELDTIENAYDGLIVACKEDENVYVRFNGGFKKLGSAGSGAFTYSFTLNLSGDTNTENDYLTR